MFALNLKIPGFAASVNEKLSTLQAEDMPLSNLCEDTGGRFSCYSSFYIYDKNNFSTEIFIMIKLLSILFRTIFMKFFHFAMQINIETNFLSLGKLYSIGSHKMLMQSLESIAQKIAIPGVIISFEKYGPDPEPISKEGKNF